MRVLMADDEPLARERLRSLLEECPRVELVGEAVNGVQVLEALQRTAVDVLLLDIDMPELDGLEVAASLGTTGPSFIFVTAHDAHALHAFELAAVDYVLKPVRLERLRTALARAEQARQSANVGRLLRELAPRAGPRRMAIRCGARFHVFDPARISALLAEDDGTTLLVDDRELLADESIDALEARLDPDVFLRIHRSALINLNFLEELRREGDRQYAAVLSNHQRTRAQVSRERLKVLKDRLGLS